MHALYVLPNDGLHESMLIFPGNDGENVMASATPDVTSINHNATNILNFIVSTNWNKINSPKIHNNVWCMCVYSRVFGCSRGWA